MSKVRDYDKFLVRLPDGMRDEIKSSAALNERSMNDEIIERLTRKDTFLRDWYAGQAMQGAVAGHLSHYGHDNYWDPESLATFANRVADAMLKAREGGAS